MLLANDPLGAFLDYEPIPVRAAANGPLAGLTLAVKDLYDVAGYPTGGGHPLRRAMTARKDRNALAIEGLLQSGAVFVGKTHTDEFAYSMNGENVHYGTPVNPRAPGRIPGGSSSGSAAAVAAGLVDIALGSDTGGSIRLPASYCGLIGLRTTHGKISLQGVQPLAPTFDTVGWFARDIDTYRAVADVLLGPGDGQEIKRVLVATDILSFVAGPAERAESDRCLRQLGSALRIEGEVEVSEGSFDPWRQVFRIVQAFEAWQAHGEWIETHQPVLGEGIRERFEWARTVSRADYDAALRDREAIKAHIRGLVPPGTALVFPTAPSAAPVRGRSGQDLEQYRVRAISMLCSAGLAGLPQVSLPIGTVEGLPFGISLLGCAGSDLALLDAGSNLVNPKRERVATT